MSVPVCLVSSCNYMELVLRAAANGGRCLLFLQKNREAIGGMAEMMHIVFLDAKKIALPCLLDAKKVGFSTFYDAN